MENDVDIQLYFTLNAPHKLRSRVIDVLTEYGVTTMRDLGEKDYVWLMTIFKNDTRGFALALNLKDKYTKSVRTREMISEGEQLIETYFSENLSQNLQKGAVTRLVRNLNRAGMETMKELCMASGDELRNIRFIGKNSYEVIFNMRTKYLAEKSNSMEV